MTTLVRLGANDRDPLRNIAVLTELLGGLDPKEEPREVGDTTEHVTYCPVPEHGGDGDQNPSLAVIEQPSNKRHPIRVHCRGGCTFERIMEVLRERMNDPSFSADAAETDYARAVRKGQQTDNAPDAPTVALPDKVLYLLGSGDAAGGNNGQRPPPGQAGTTEDGPHDDAEGATETALPDYLTSLEAYCYSPGFLHDNPDLPVIADAQHRGVAFLYPGTRGADGGETRKVRCAVWVDGVLCWADGNDKVYNWVNPAKPLPTWWPLPRRTMGARVAFCEGETSTIALRRAGFEAYGLVAGARDLPEEEIDGLEEAYARGVREALLFYDRDKSGLNFKKGMVARCIAAGIEPIPVDIRPLIDVYGGGNKDARDLLGLFEGNADALRAALDDVIARADAQLDDLFPPHTSAIKDVVVEWIWPDILARNQITFLSSAPGLGKTTIIHAYCVAARDGGEVLGRLIAPHKVLLVTEEGRVSLAAKAVLFGDFPNVRVHSIDDGPFASDVWDDRLRIIKRAAKRFGVQTVVLDTFLSFCLAEDEDRAATLRPLLNQVRYLATDGIGVIGTFHDTKAGSPFAGSGSIKGQCDIAIALRPSPDHDPTHRGLDFIKNRLSPALDNKEWTVTMDGTRFIIVPPIPPCQPAAGAPDDGTPGQTVVVRFPVSAAERNRRAVLAAATEEWQDTADMAQASGVRGGSFTRAAKSLVADGLLEHDPRKGSGVAKGAASKKNYYRKPPMNNGTDSPTDSPTDSRAEEAQDA